MESFITNKVLTNKFKTQKAIPKLQHNSNHWPSATNSDRKPFYHNLSVSLHPCRASLH